MKILVRCVPIFAVLAALCVTSPASASTGASATTSVQNGYAGHEMFCGTAGTVTYSVAKRTVTVTADIHNLVKSKQYSLIWRNNSVRGYTIGAFETTSGGTVTPNSLRLFRSAETHGIGVIVYYLVGVNPKAILHFKPC